MYNEQYFQALDYILDEAAKVGVRLILTLADNWSPVDSKSQVTSPSKVHAVVHAAVRDVG